MNPSPPSRDIFPVGLLLQGRSCLVVGGGRGAARKVEALLQARASVTVVSPELGEALARRREEGRLEWIPRAYQAEDLTGRFLVYSAVPDEALNRAVLAECRRRNILCCPIDGSWPEGDFLTPAALRRGDLSVAISTGGRSCRRSRLVKESLSRHLEVIDSSRLLLMGTSHAHLSLERREPFHLAGEKLDETGGMLRHVWGLREFCLLNTCNRVELWAVVSDAPEAEALIRKVLGFDALAEGEFYAYRGWEAFAHSCTLLAGLFSQTPGENHIVAQVKEAHGAAGEFGWTGVLLEDWLGRALGISKKIRRRTGPLLKDMEIEDVTLEYLLRARGEERPLRRAMVIGTGVIGRGVAARFLRQGIAVVWCYHRFVPDAGEFRDLPGTLALCSLEELEEQLPLCDCVVAATGSPAYLLDEAHDRLFPPDGMTLLVDLSLPRNISPGLNRLDGSVRVVDLDDLKHWFRRTLADMDRVREECRRIIDENRENYERIVAGLESRNP